MAKKRLGTGYTFTAASKTVAHADFSDITLAGIQLIVNVTDQIIIYNFADTTKGGTLATDTLTLEYDTTSMSDTDELMILVEDGIASQAVTAASLPLPTGASTSAKQDTIIGHLDGVEGLLTTIDADTGTIATEIAGLLTDTELRASPVPVSGTVTANLSATDNAVLDAIEADTTTLAGAIAGTEMQVDVVTSALPTGASTSANQTTIISHLDGVEGLLTTIDADTSILSGLVLATQADDVANTSDGLQTTNFNMVFDGTTWDRLRGTSADGVLVNLGTNNDVTVTGTVDLGATDNAVLDAIAASVAAIDTDTTTVIGHLDGVETLLGTIDADTGNISTKIDTIAGAVSGTEMQVDVLTMPTVTVTATNLDVQSGGADLATSTQAGAIQTAVELIDDAVFVDDADWTADTSKHLLVGGVTQVTTTANTDGDVTPLTTNAFRELRVAIPESDLATAGTAHVKKYYTNAGAVTDGIIWSPAAGKRWYITSIFINVSAACTVTLEDDLAGGDSPIMKAELAANSGWSSSFPVPWFSGEDAADLIITTTAGNVYCTVVGYEI